MLWVSVYCLGMEGVLLNLFDFVQGKKGRVVC